MIIESKCIEPRLLSITWTYNVAKSNDSLIGFRIYFKKKDAVEYTVTDAPNEMNQENNYSIIITDIQIDTSYTIKLCAFNQYGCGPMTNELNLSITMKS